MLSVQSDISGPWKLSLLFDGALWQPSECDAYTLLQLLFWNWADWFVFREHLIYASFCWPSEDWQTHTYDEPAVSVTGLPVSASMLL